MSPIVDPLFYLVAVPAVILVGVSKSGFGGAVGSLGVPLMATAVSPSQAVAIMLPILLALDAMGLVTFRSRVDWRILRIAIPSGLLGILVGWALFRSLDDRWIRALIGVEAVVFAVAKLREGASAWEGPPRPVDPRKGMFWSALSGFTSFISHAGSPPMMQFMMPLRLERTLFVGTMAWFFAAINFAKLAPYAQLGLFEWGLLGTTLALMPAVPVGYAMGLWVLKRIGAALFVRVATVGLLLTGVKLLFDAWR